MFNPNSLKSLNGKDFSKPMGKEAPAAPGNPMEDLFAAEEVGETPEEEAQESGAEGLENALMGLGFEVDPDKLEQIKAILGAPSSDLGGGMVPSGMESDIGNEPPMAPKASKLGNLFGKK